MYYLEPINAANWADYVRLIPRSLFAFGPGAGNAIGVGARLFGEAVGAAVAKPSPNFQKVAVLSSCAVAPSQRRAGIGSKMLANIESTLSSQGYSRCDTWLMEDDIRRQSITGLLGRNGWSKPEPFAYFCSSNFETLTKAPWMNLSLPSEFEPFHWSQLTAEDRKSIEAWVAAGILPGPLNPLTIDPSIPMPVGSIGLRKDGRLAAWCVTTHTTARKLATHSLFADPALGRPTLAIVVLAKAISLAPECEFSWDVSFERAGMVRFVDRRMRPFLTSLRRALRSSKSLTPAVIEVASKGINHAALTHC